MNFTPQNDATTVRGDAACGNCRATDFAFRWQTFANGTRHVRVDCHRCGAYVRYAPQTAENVARADAAATRESAS